MRDFDNFAKYWISHRPYVWIENESFQECRRQYIMMDDDIVYVKTPYFYTTGPERIFTRFRKFKDYSFEKDGVAHVVMLRSPLEETASVSCFGWEWVSHFFEVWTGTIVDLATSEVRIDGKKVEYTTKEIYEEVEKYGSDVLLHS